jgi:hypothetical protein
MKSLLNISYRRLCLLAGVDGLIVGVVTESLYKYYYVWEWRRAAEYHYKLGLGGDVERGPLSVHNHFAIPFLYVAAFLVSACLLRYFLSRRRLSLVIFWQFVAVTAVTIAAILYFHEFLYIDLAAFAQPNSRYDLLGIFSTWMACILIACSINLIYGAIVQSFKKGDFGGGATTYH